MMPYTSSPDRVRRFVVKEGWFAEDKILVGVPS